MPIELTRSPVDIAQLLSDFDPCYHQDFCKVRLSANAYLASRTSESSAKLATELTGALVHWGAGRRRAPTLRSLDEITGLLNSTSMHSLLVHMRSIATAGIGVQDHRRVVSRREQDENGVRAFDEGLFNVLTSLSQRLFVNNTSVTYPMKAVLLITGLIPAFDSQVKQGLRRSGLSGFAGTRFLFPANRTEVGWLKLSRLPFLLGQCWAANRHVFREAICLSNYPGLINEPGRVFDMLLFAQANEQSRVVLTYRGLNTWYRQL